MFQDVGLAHICDGASEQGARSGLNTLVVWNNQITYESMMALGRALVRLIKLYCLLIIFSQCVLVLACCMYQGTSSLLHKSCVQFDNYKANLVLVHSI